MDNSKFNQQSLLPIGTLLQMGKYRVDRYLSSGGFGNTYVITNLQFDEQFALKEFFMKGINERDDDSTTVSVSNKDNHTQFEQQREKFKKEARRLRKLHNKHIIRVHDLFEENGTAYYVMDLIDGQSVSNLLEKKGKPLPESQALNIIHQVLDALNTVHQKGIWHLDLKPGNIMLDKQGNAVVIDFGASKQLNVNEGYSSTSTAMAYTKGYAPSEQMDQNIAKIGPWTDLYALGATLYNMVTFKEPPYVSEIYDGNAFKYPNSISEKTRKLIQWMMSPSRQKRPQSVYDIYQYLNIPIINNNEIYNKSDETTVYSNKQSESEKTELPTKQQAKKRKNNLLDFGQKFISDAKADKTKRYVVLLIVASVIISFIYLLSQSNEPKYKPTNIGNTTIVAPPLPPEKKINIQNPLLDSISKTNGKVSIMCERVKYYSGENAVIRKEKQSSLGSYYYTGPTDESGNPNGTGLAEFKDNRLYIGTFYHGKMQGDAYFRYENGDTFEGDFTNKSKFGKGKYTIREDGSYFIGSFKNGQPNEGQWYDKNGNKIN